MSHFKAFPKILSFRGILSDFISQLDENHSKEDLPVSTFNISVKLHGTNACIALSRDGKYFTQSRTRIVTPQNDNEGFASWAYQDDVKSFFTSILQERLEKNNSECEYIYGEWCGRGIQRGTAINTVDDKFFYVFDDDKRLSTFPNVYNRFIIKHNMIIDFSKDDEMESILQSIADEVGNECPFSKNVLSVEGRGEGIVCEAEDKYGFIRFKVKASSFSDKGSKQNSDKGSKQNKKICKDESVENFYMNLAERLCPVWRLEQGFSVIKEKGLSLSEKSIGEYLKFVMSDVWEEEGYNLKEYDLDKRLLNKSLSRYAKDYFFKNVKDWM